MNKIFVHIGMPKTASTSMQKLLKQSEKEISQYFYIPKACQTTEEYVNHANLFFEFSKDYLYDPALGSFSDLLKEIEKVKKNIILSSEAFSLMLLNDKHKIFFENSLKKLNFEVVYLCFYRNEVGYFFSTLKELKNQRLRQPPPFNKFSYIDDLVHFKNALLHGWVYDDLNQRDAKYKMYFNIKKFKKKIERNSSFKFKYFKHCKTSLLKFGNLFGIKHINTENFQMNVVHKKNLKYYLYLIPGIIIYILYKKSINENENKYLLDAD
tara:strand:+ start:139 stop:939 length:801 start_codon:yes stop_codon:yes gene_type:complete